MPFTSLISYMNALLKILKITFVFMISVQNNGKVLRKVPKRTPLLCVQECDNECNPQDCDLGNFDLAVFDETTRDAMAQQQDQLLPIQHGRNRGIYSMPQSEQLRFSCFGNSLLDADSSQLRLNSGVGLVLHLLTSSSMRTTICSMCVPRCYRWEFAGGQNCPVARGATMFLFQHDS